MARGFLVKKGMVRQWDGNVISEAGIYKGISLELYHSAELFGGKPAVSSSGLRKIWSYSPAHYFSESPYNPKRKPEKDKSHFALGRAVHHLLLSEPEFRRFFIIRPETVVDDKTGEIVKWNANRKACIRWLAEQRDLGKTILTIEMAENVQGMLLETAKHPLVRRGLLKGLIEHSFFWRDRETGIWLKWRPDAVPTSSNDFVDIKTTRDVRWFAIRKTIDDYGYHQQGGLGREACRELLGREMNSFSLFFIESENPWSTALHEVESADLDLGARMNRSALRTFWHCWKEKRWPGPATAEIDHIRMSESARERTVKLLEAEGL